MVRVSWRGRGRGQGVAPLRPIPDPIAVAGTGYSRKVRIRTFWVQTAGDRVRVATHCVYWRDLCRPAGGCPQRRTCYIEICHYSALHTQLGAKLRDERVQLRWLAHHIARKGLGGWRGRIDRISRHELGLLRDQKLRKKPGIAVLLRAYQPARYSN